MKEKEFESIEHREISDFVLFHDVLGKLGQIQYVSRFVNPDQKFHDDGTPFFSDIRVEGDCDDYHNLKIHRDDIEKFIEKWLEYKKETSPFFGDKKIEDFL